ncbi:MULTISPECIES: OsmC family protein [Pseudomonas]|uniref:OsmC family protein n=1 Tax=Pseudomonas TaxID=286 RepID=UPI002305CBA8|nr:OsmC family protein [Pseudomonas sp. TUM22785]WCD78407.1 OsmC family protein [Pseudomonas sp. TUM22785]
MTITVTTESADGYRHSINVGDEHQLFTDLPKALGGEGSAPEPHDYFDVALGACKALTVTLYARSHDIPLTGIGVDVTHDSSQEKQGQYGMSVKLTLRGALTDDQRATLLRIADKCPLHKLMTTTEVTIETRLAEGDFSQ